ncbi:MAG: hypothetical protein CTY24_13750 [Methylobacter sp.]|nr:MAG: hypothetical protein CTY24_13750 [Methylobacter sp.]
MPATPKGSAINASPTVRQELTVAVKPLDSIYQRLNNIPPIDEIDDYPPKILILAQREWIQYHYPQSGLLGEVNEGARMGKSAYGVNCNTEIIKARTQALIGLFKSAGHKQKLISLRSSA